MVLMSEAFIDTTPVPEEEISIARIKEVYGDMLARPSFLQIVEDAGRVPSPEDVVRYEAATTDIRNGLGSFSGATEEERQQADQLFMAGMFGSSDGDEVRLVLTGFKPAVFTGLMFEEKPPIGNIPLSSISAEAFVTLTDQYPNIEYEQGVVSNYNSDLYRAGVLYDATAVSVVMQHNQDIFEALGFDPSKTPDDFVYDVLSDGNPIATSLILGYGPFTSVFFHLMTNRLRSTVHAKALERATGDPGALEKKFWDSLPRLLNDEQLAIAYAIGQNTALVNSSEIINLGTTNEEYIWNDHSELWGASGMGTYVEAMKASLK